MQLPHLHLVAFAVCSLCADAFLLPPTVGSSQTGQPFHPQHVDAFNKASKKRMAMLALDPSMVDAAIALSSAVAGAASQFPRIQKLEKELDITRAALTQSELELVDKINELEEKLFRMDQEFESQTAKIRKNFDNTLRQELEKVRNKAKEEYQFSLDIKLQEERSKMLQEKLAFVGAINGDKDVELVNLRLKQAQVKDTNQKLEDALLNAEKELERIQNSGKNKGWWPF